MENKENTHQSACFCQKKCGECSKKQNHIIVGAGLVGAMTALIFGKKGIKTSVYEKRNDLRKSYTKDHRSINLALSYRGWQMLKIVGLEKEVSEIVLPMYGRQIHKVDGSVVYQPYGKDDEAIYSVPRNKLNEIIIDAAEQFSEVQFYFNHKVSDIDFESKKCKVMDESEVETEIQPNVILGSDGVFSVVRQKMQEKLLFNAKELTLEQRYKELSIRPNEDGTWKIDHQSLHIWPRKDFMLIALPNLDGSFTCTLFLAQEGENSFDTLKNETDVRAFFEKFFPDLIDLMPHFCEDFFNNPTSRIVAIKCYPWHYRNFVSLIGDSAHAVVPFYGQGMNAGFEDCLALSELLEENQHLNWGGILTNFFKARKANSDAIYELSLQNFIEMSDKVADPKFLLRKQIEAYINKNHPELWTPLYSLVSFSGVPYSDVLNISQEQDEFMQRLMKVPNIEDIWQELNYEAMFGTQKQPYADLIEA